jgi:hypothetical protein
VIEATWLKLVRLCLKARGGTIQNKKSLLYYEPRREINSIDRGFFLPLLQSPSDLWLRGPRPPAYIPLRSRLYLLPWFAGFRLGRGIVRRTNHFINLTVASTVIVIKKYE